MNEFEWQRQLRKLQTPVAPQRDLWSGIEAALEANVTPVPRPSRRGAMASRWLLAAGFAGLSLLAISLTALQQRQGGASPMSHAIPAQTVAPWKPEDPRLAGAAIELDAARIELRQALEQSPHSAALQRLLSRNEQQQSYLRHLDQAG